MTVFYLNGLTEELSEEPSVEEEKSCPECGSLRQVRDYKRGEVVCRDCGLVIEDKIMDPGPEWRLFETDQIQVSRQRTGDPITYTLHDKGLSTVIDTRDYDAAGRPLSPLTRGEMRRLRRWNRRSLVDKSIDRNLLYALSELDRVASQLQLPRKVRESASVIYRRAFETGLLRGRSIECSTASVIYIACRELGIARTLQEVATVTKYTKKDIGRTYRLILRGLGLHLPPVSAIDYLARFTSSLGLPPRVERKAIEIIKEMMNHGLCSGKGPMGMAGASIYTACVLEDVDLTQGQVAEIVGVTPVTIRNRYKEITEYLDLDGSGKVSEKKRK